jgi:hypothetical protein
MLSDAASEGAGLRFRGAYHISISLNNQFEFSIAQHAEIARGGR